MTPQPDFKFTCPSLWTEGAVENLVCVIPRSKFSRTSDDGLCAHYGDSVSFKIIKGNKSRSACLIVGFDTTCNGSVNVDGCGCREISGGNIVIDYNITAVRAAHEGVHWVCEPQCQDVNAVNPVLTPPNTTECFYTKFRKYIGIYSSYLINCFHYYHENHFQVVVKYYFICV